ncbi:MAG: hypothetical protein ACI9FR_001882 [Cryomorphaceae bacterium]
MYAAFFSSAYVKDFSLPSRWGLDIHCKFSDDLALMEQADALWFHGPSIRKLPKRKFGPKMDTDVDGKRSKLSIYKQRRSDGNVLYKNDLSNSLA